MYYMVRLITLILTICVFVFQALYGYFGLTNNYTL